jgi:2-polyprenyl-3-methyl-5-hydroxy-6-metoxy-1,4-benzoquinol methylase
MCEISWLPHYSEAFFSYLHSGIINNSNKFWDKYRVNINRSTLFVFISFNNWEIRENVANVAEDITNRFLEELRIERGMRILDIGCGRGDLSLLLSRYVGNNGSVVGLDIDEDVLLFAGNRCKENIVKVSP